MQIFPGAIIQDMNETFYSNASEENSTKIKLHIETNDAPILSLKRLMKVPRTTKVLCWSTYPQPKYISSAKIIILILILRVGKANANKNNKKYTE